VGLEIVHHFSDEVLLNFPRILSTLPNGKFTCPALSHLVTESISKLSGEQNLTPKPLVNTSEMTERGLGMAKRCTRIIVSNEARVLRQLRLSAGLSMKKAGTALGLSDSYISHVETGRMDVPKGERLSGLLDLYGGLSTRAFYQRARAYAKRQTPKDELAELIQRANLNQTRALLLVVRGILAGVA